MTAATSAQPLRDQRILVTGGAGTIGSTIVDQLVDDGAAEVVVLDNFVRGRHANLDRAERLGNIAVIDGDIRDRQLLADALAGVDVVFHQAAIRITQCAEEPRLALEVLADGTFNVLEAAVAAGVKKVIAASSAYVNGQATVFPTDELHHPYANDTLYGAAKTFNEGLLRSFHAMYGLDYVALRYFNVIGPRMDVHGLYTEVLVRWIERIERGEPLLILGDGTQTMDFVDVRDVARANILAAQAPATGVALNVASGNETSLKELADALLRVTGSGIGIEYGPARSVNAVQRRLGDTVAAAELIGFRTRIGLDESLHDLVSWFRSERTSTA
jgi:UDP-glucose 4-epimerase